MIVCISTAMADPGAIVVHVRRIGVAIMVAERATTTVLIKVPPILIVAMPVAQVGVASFLSRIASLVVEVTAIALHVARGPATRSTAVHLAGAMLGHKAAAEATARRTAVLTATWIAATAAMLRKKRSR